MTAEDPAELTREQREQRAKKSKHGTGRLIDPKRIEAAIDLLAQGHSAALISRKLARKFGCSYRSGRRYVQVARDRLGRNELPPEERESAREEVLRKLEAAFEIAAEKRDAKNMIAATARIAEVQGLIGTRKVELSGGLNLNVDTASLAQRIAALSAAGVEAALSDAAPAGAQAALASGAAGDRSGDGAGGASAA